MSKSFSRWTKRGNFSPSLQTPARCAAFSLVEVVLAIGIVAFAFVAIFSLVPVGLGTFRDAMNNSIGSQIVQRLVNEAQQTDYPTLTAVANAKTTRYFDDQGNEQTVIADSIYTVEVTVVPKTNIPNTSTANSESLATVTIKLANNPGHTADPFAPNTTVRYTTHTALIAKNQ